MRTITPDVDLIESSPFFAPAFYAQRAGVPLQDAARHYLDFGAALGLDPSANFDSKYYQGRYQVDAATENPLLHYHRVGQLLGFVPWGGQWVNKRQSVTAAQALGTIAATRALANVWPMLRAGRDQVWVFVHSRSHTVFHEFQTMILIALQSLGIEANGADESLRPPTSVIPIVIAPHDFFFLTDLQGFPIDAAIVVNTEQLQSIWLGRSLPYLFRARAVLDINVQTGAALADLGIPIRFLQLGYVPGYPVFQPDLPLSEPLQDQLRGISYDPGDKMLDLVWIGSNSKRRLGYLERNMDVLRRLRCFVRLVNVVGPLRSDHPEAISALEYASLAQRSRILLNIHHFETPYFEWQRLVHFGFLQGACVLTETASTVPHLISGEHYLEAEADELAPFAEWLSRDPEGRNLASEIARKGYAAARKEFDLTDGLREIFSIQGDAQV